MYINRTNNRATAQMSLDDIRRVAPSVFATHASDDRSARYTMIPTSAVVEGMIKEGFYPVAASQTRTHLADKRDFARHLVRFRHADHLQALQTVGQTIPEIVVLNSHDGTSSYQIHAGMFRLACSNGLIVADGTLQAHRVHHKGDIVGRVIDAAYEVVREVPALTAKIGEYQSITLDDNESKIFAESALALRYDADNPAPFSVSQVLRPNRGDDKGSDLWTKFNVVQEKLLRGGLRGISSTGRRSTTRAVSSINENVRLNKALWELTEKMAALKQS